MGNIEPKPVLIGMASRKITSIMDANDLEFDDAFSEWRKGLSETLIKYDWDKVKTQLEKKCNCASPEEEKGKGKGKKPSEKPSEKPITPPKEKPKGGKKPKATAPKTDLIEPPTKKYSMPKGIRAKGEFEVVEDAEGTKIRRTDDTKSIAIKCGKGQIGVQINEDEVACADPDLAGKNAPQ